MGHTSRDLPSGTVCDVGYLTSQAMCRVPQRTALPKVTACPSATTATSLRLGTLRRHPHLNLVLQRRQFLRAKCPHLWGDDVAPEFSPTSSSSAPRELSAPAQ